LGFGLSFGFFFPLPALRRKLLQAKLLFRHRPAIQSTQPNDARIIGTLRADGVFGMVNPRAHHGKAMKTKEEKRGSHRNEIHGSNDDPVIQDVLSRLKAKKVLSKSAHDFQLFESIESHENSCH